MSFSSRKTLKTIKNPQFFQRVRIFFVIFCVFLNFGYNTYATSEDFFDAFAANDIKFYDPRDCETTDASTQTTLSGNTNVEMIWNYFIGQGFNDMQTAGILGNIQAESGFVPTRGNGQGFWGLFQWGYGRYENIARLLRDAGLGQYLGEEYQGPEGDASIPEEDKKKIIQIELDYAMSEDSNDWKNEMKTASSVEEAAEIFLCLFEIAINGDSPIEYYGRHLGELYQATDVRRDFAKELLSQYSGSGPSASTSSGIKLIDGSNLVWIGDSISHRLEGSFGTDYFAENLPKTLHDNHDSRQFDVTTSAGGEGGIQVLQKLKEKDQLRDILVFALGTNSSGSVTEENINKVLELASDVKLVVFVTNYTANSDYAANNNAMKAAALANEKVIVADWASAVSSKVSSYLDADGIHPNAEGLKVFYETIINAINGSADGDIPDACCDTSAVKSTDRTFSGTKYDLTVGQLKGLIAVASKKNGENTSQLKTAVALMANRFEKEGSSFGSDAEGLVKYVQESGYYEKEISDAYDEKYEASQKHIDAVKDVLVSGNRPIPAEVIEQASPDAKIIEADNSGTSFDVTDRSQYKSGVTRITKKSDKSSWIFYAWADESTDSGDLFGYSASNPPSGNGTTQENSDACCETSGAITTANINGHKYAFPIAGATKANYLNPGGDSTSYLSSLPCSSSAEGACHHEYYAVDMGVRMKMIKGGSDPDFEECGEAFMCYSVGAEVVAPIAGTVTKASHSYSGAVPGYEDKCGSVTLAGEDGNTYWLGHLSEAGLAVEDGQAVSAGDKLGEVGIPPCAQGTQSHLHIDNYFLPEQADSAYWTVDLMNQLWEHLPDSDSGSGVEQCSDTGLKVGGFSLEEAEAFMEDYRALALEVYHSGKTSIEVNGRILDGAICDEGLLFNCVALSRYFIYKYLNDAPDGAYENLGNGNQVVGSLADLGFKTGTEPRPYAIFSWDNGGYGHTGVVLGVIDKDTFITGESSCTDGNAGTGAFVRKLSTAPYPYTFAYTDGMINGI